MNKEQLSEYTYILKEIELLKERILEVESMIKYKSIDYSMKVKSKSRGNANALLLDLKTCLEEKLEQRLLMQLKIENYIKSVKSSEMRTILVLKYIRGYSWLKVSMALGGYDEQYARKKLDRFLKKFNNE